jgi:hypothetical protein
MKNAVSEEKKKNETREDEKSLRAWWQTLLKLTLL